MNSSQANFNYLNPYYDISNPNYYDRRARQNYLQSSDPIPDCGPSRCPLTRNFFKGMLFPGWCVSTLLTGSILTLTNAVIFANGGFNVPTSVYVAGGLGMTAALIYSVCSGIANVNRDNLNRSALADCIVRAITGGDAIQSCRCPV